jgi:beta-xylosidase
MTGRRVTWALALMTIPVFGGAAQRDSDSAVSESAAPWVADLGDGRYRNPVLAADYSDPDVVRVGNDYYLTSSSFTNVPGLPILHSKDLVNWTLVGHGLERLTPPAHYLAPRRGGGVWAPAIRFHDGRFYIYYPDPDFGIYVITADRPEGPWSVPKLIDASRGVIDPCPFWDDDGSAWLIVAWAKSRAGFNNVLTLRRLSRDGLQVLDPGQIVIDGHRLAAAHTSVGPMDWEPIEGPKLYKRDGWYYIFAAAGGVRNGWQAAFRARRLTGPYEPRVIMDQGRSPTNGPHQGAWVRTARGEDWFLHFQDTDAYGRRVHLQPLSWRDGWPVAGMDADGSGRGEPVTQYRKPVVEGNEPIAIAPLNDEFDRPLSLAWQWSANPQEDWLSLDAAPGWLRLKSISSSANLYEAGNLLTQKIPGPVFTATTRMRFEPKAVGERAGLLVFGNDYAWIGLTRTAAGLQLVQGVRKGADNQQPELQAAVIGASRDLVYLRVHAEPEMQAPPAGQTPRWPSSLRVVNARVRFSYSLDGTKFIPFGEEFVARQGRWVGTVFGLFAQAPTGTPSNVATSVGHASFDWFRVTR